MHIERKFHILLLSLIIFLLSACSSNDATDSTDMLKTEDSAVSNEIAVMDKGEMSTQEDANDGEHAGDITGGRMIVHRATLEVNVKSLEEARQNIEKKVKAYGGYIVESNVYRESDERMSGHITVRIPEKHFETFLNDAEEVSAQVLGRTVTGQDVTEEYVDLESRLKSKRTVEERLLEFMKDADKTEDLLKISSDLAKVQEEIEVLVGQMNYLENQTAFSTVELYMYENRVIVPGIDGKDLNTVERIKKQLAASTNFLLAAGSGIVVFLIGNLPVLLLLGLIGIGGGYVVKRRRSKRSQEQ